MSVREAYDAWAATYDTDRNATRDLDRAATEAALAGVHCGTIIELGCGTGKNTGFLARLGTRVLALDFSPAMLAQARRKVSAVQVAFAVADLTAPWPCAAGAADLVAANLVFEHIAALPFVFGEAYRCLAAGGHLFVCELHPFRQYLGVQARFRRGESDVAITAFVHHLSDFLAAAGGAGLTLVELREWWDGGDRGAPPRLVSFLWRKVMGG
ncbi:MAG TPA: class I SAM-dependent methyltransferase [Thermomicrobiales bacterium]|nr:class I SAM-dependent methyltransferase [Thermomicrobiales bacterium]